MGLWSLNLNPTAFNTETHVTMNEEIEPHILDRYEIIQKLGKGAYGIVWKTIDKQTKEKVALKKIYDAFRNSTDAQRTYREVMYLYHFNNNENIVKLLDVIKAHNNKDLYMVFEIMETDLHIVIRSKFLKSVHKQFITYQLFKVLKYIHSANVVHRDLKPSNMLVNADCLMKLADFGLARSLSHDDDGFPPIVSDYIATRWYRAPEILLGSQRYSKAIDVWSAGCIMAELLLEKALFPGKSSLNQLEIIIELLGRPTQDEIRSMKISHGSNLMDNINGKRTKVLNDIFAACSPESIDLLRQILVYNPEKRISVENALLHPYFAKFHNPKLETTCSGTIVIPINDNEKHQVKVYRQALYNDVTAHLQTKVQSYKRHKKLPDLNKSKTVTS